MHKQAASMKIVTFQASFLQIPFKKIKQNVSSFSSLLSITLPVPGQISMLGEFNLESVCDDRFRRSEIHRLICEKK